MCFSAPVSFAASAALAAVGGGLVHKVKTRRELPLALIPLLFAVQQFIEGLLWLVLPQAGMGIEQYRLTQTYAVFVGIVWPVLIPFALLMIEPDGIRKRLLQAVLLLGVGIAFYTLNIIARFGVSSMIADQCIVYSYPGDQMVGTLTAYFIATCMGFFLSSHRDVRWVGVANVVGFIAAYYFYRFSYASTWCFFAAAVSGLIYVHFYRLRERDATVEEAAAVA